MHRRLILSLAAFAGLATAMPAFATAAYARPVERHAHAVVHRTAPVRHRKVLTHGHARPVARGVRRAA